MRVSITGASGLIGRAMVSALRARGDEVTVLSRDPERAHRRLEDPTQPPTSLDGSLGALRTTRWQPIDEAAPVEGLAERDAVVHLAGENVAQRWTTRAKQMISESRVTGTRHLVQGLEACAAGERPRVLVSSSAIGYYGPRGDEPIDEEAPRGNDFLARTCGAWEAEARSAETLGVRVVSIRTGVVLDREGGALGKMLPPFRLGVGGPVGSGRQYVSWIGVDDVAGIMMAAIDGEEWHGPINATAPEPVTNRDFSKRLGHALHRPSLIPVPGFVLRLLYGEMAEIVSTGARVLPANALVLGYEFHHPELDGALHAALGGP